mmetsp:Transcript_18957/g.28612  ORF Transcript_18957/g.28612 Transcript_18957/m.28612 type:complete len:163 (-) Transcript_18957:931-1419(-)
MMTSSTISNESNGWREMILHRASAISCREIGSSCFAQCDALNDELNSIVVRKRSIMYELDDAIPIELGCTAEKWPIAESSYVDLYDERFGWRLRSGPRHQILPKSPKTTQFYADTLITPSFGLCPKGSAHILYRKPAPKSLNIKLEKIFRIRNKKKRHLYQC